MNSRNLSTQAEGAGVAVDFRFPDQTPDWIWEPRPDSSFTWW
ncbi:MAG TPA: hypothetical protein PK640_18025 [Verrucomicrobiota bacterium]|nr:hypothetical protein [Verrucomicrobiota bacterium]